MSSSPPISTADLGDRHRRYLVLAMLAVGLLYGFSAASHFVAPVTASVLEVLQVLTGVAMLGFMAPILLWKIRASSEEWNIYGGEDGFIQDALSRAHIASWGSTFLLLALLVILDETLAAVPARVQLEGVMAAMLIVFGVVFLFLSRVPEEDDPEAHPDA